MRVFAFRVLGATIVATLMAVPTGCGDSPQPTGPADDGPGAIAGSVVYDGQLLNAAIVTVRQGGAVLREIVTDEAGSFFVDDLQPGSYDVGAAYSDLGCHDLAVTVPAGGVATADVDCEYPAGSVVGAVTLLGKPLRGAIVTLRWGFVIAASTTVGPDGSFDFEGIAESAAIVSTTAGALDCPDTGADVQRWQTVTVVVECTLPFDNRLPGIYLAAADGSQPVFLAAGGSPAWSPDGSRIAFVDDGWIHVIDADGTGLVTLAEGAEPAWSPDGARIAFADGGGISAMNPDGSGVVQLIEDSYASGASTSFGIGEPAWSPDGQTIAFERRGNDAGQVSKVLLMDADGSNARVPIGTTFWFGGTASPAWANDGQTLAFSITLLGIRSIATTRLEQAVISLLERGDNPAWSPDGKAILFTDQSCCSNTGPESIYVVHRSEGQWRAPAQLLIYGGSDPTWSPDGARIAFVRGAD